MRIEEIIVNIIFDAGRGSTPVQSREGISGQRYGELPRPTRAGYSFEGWYLGEELITSESILQSESDVRLTARWARKKTEVKKNSVMYRQKLVACVLAVAIVFLAVALAVANRIVAIYHLTDRWTVDGVEYTERYTIKRRDGVYKMFSRNGTEMPKTPDGYTSSSDGIRYEVYEALATENSSGNQYLINTKTGEYEEYAVVDYDGNIGESLGGTVINKRVMMFPRVGQDNTYSITVNNEYGSFKFYRKSVLNEDADAKTKYKTTVHIEGTEDTMTTYDPTLFASLCVSCGYTLTMNKLDLTSPEAPRLPDGSINYDSYGLVERRDAEGNVTYKPATYTIVKAEYAADGSCKDSGVSYTVTVGEAILSGAGYYVQLQGRDAVYIVSSEIGKTVMQPVEALVTPSIIYPMTVSTYVMVYDFRFGTQEQFDPTADQKGENVNLLAAFNFVDLSKRENSIYSSTPYTVDPSINLMNGYQFNTDSVSFVLERLYNMEGMTCKLLNPKRGTGIGEENDFKTYNLDKDVYYLTFKYDPKVASGGSEESEWVESTMVISQRTEDGTYYIYSYLYDMIVEVDQYYFSYLEWGQSRWYSQYFFQNNIGHIKSLSLSMNGKTYSFTLDNRLSYAYYDAGKDANGNQTAKMVDLSKGTLVQDAEGNYHYTITKTQKTYRVYLMDLKPENIYRDSSTKKIMYRGEAGLNVELSLSSSNMQVICPQYEGKDGSHVLDYELPETEDATAQVDPDTEMISALSNFRRLYSKLLWFSIEGDVNQKELGSSVKEYIATHEATAEIRYSLEDLASLLNPENYKENNKRDCIIRLYRYTEGKMLLTVEMLDGPDDTPNPNRAEGSFWVNAAEMEDIMGYAEDLLNEKLLPKST